MLSILIKLLQNKTNYFTKMEIIVVLTVNDVFHVVDTDCMYFDPIL